MQREEWERGEIFIYLPMVNHFHLSFPLIKPRGVWQGLDETSRGRASSEGLDWTDAKVSPRPEIPAFCDNTDIPTFTVSPVATLVSKNLANGSRTMSQTLLLYFSELQTLPDQLEVSKLMSFRSSKHRWQCSGSVVSCSPPGSSGHGILQARILEWVAMPSSGGSSQPRDETRVSYVSCNAGRFFTS